MSGGEQFSDRYRCVAPPLSERGLREGITSARMHEPGTCHGCDELRRIDKMLPGVIVPSGRPDWPMPKPPPYPADDEGRPTPDA